MTAMTPRQAFEAGVISRDQFEAYQIQAGAAEQLEVFIAEWQDSYRRQLVKFAAIICGCPRRFTWSGDGAGVAPQASCPLHSQMFLDPADYGM